MVSNDGIMVYIIKEMNVDLFKFWKSRNDILEMG